MRTIKNISIIAVLAFAGLSSCSKDTATDPLVVDNSLTQPTPTALSGTTALADTKVAATALPQPVPDYVATNYPDATVSKSEVENNGNYEVMLNQGTELVFESAGTFLGVDDDTEDDFGDMVVDPAALPQPIIDYITANHVDLTIASASLENNGHYEVQLSDGTELVFDGKGVFLGIGVDNDDYNRSDDDQIPLPQDVMDYVAANYPKATISASEVEYNGNYEVELNNGTELAFDANGSFLRTDDDSEDQSGNELEDETVIDAATLPQLVKDYLSTTYPDASILEASTMADGGFEVELSTKIEVIFDANGSFVKTEVGSTEHGD